MKLQIALLALITSLFLPLRGLADTAPTMQETSIKLFESLTPEQKQAALLPYDSPEKKSEVFTGGKRPGVMIKTLNPEQQKMAMDLLTAFTSDAGKATLEKVFVQTNNNPDAASGFSRYYLCYFGEPGAGKTYAWRITEHHLTLVHVDVEKGEPTTFGPILLGSDPGDFFGDDEDKMIALYGVLTTDERAKCDNAGKSASSMPPPPHYKSVKIADLNSTAKEAAKAVVASRLAFFSPQIQQEINKAIEQNGGVDALAISFFGEATKRCREGGKWDFKLTSKDFLCDYENTRGHIHMSLKSMPVKAK